jgi:hypothetical protein
LYTGHTFTQDAQRMQRSAWANAGSFDISVRRLSTRMTWSSFGVPSTPGAGPVNMET